jgi:hypothetical protein
MDERKISHDNAIATFLALMPARSKASTLVIGNKRLSAAVACKILGQRRWEMAILQMFSGMELYAEMHRLRYEEPVGEDGIMGDAIELILAGIKELFNGEMGRLDGAAMDTLLREFAAKNKLRYPA